MRWSEDIARARRSALEIAKLLEGPKVKRSEVSEAEGRAQEIANRLQRLRQEA